MGGPQMIVDLARAGDLDQPLASGCSPNEKCPSNASTPLIAASGKGHLSIVKHRVLGVGAELDHENDDGASVRPTRRWPRDTKRSSSLWRRMSLSAAPASGSPWSRMTTRRCHSCLDGEAGPTSCAIACVLHACCCKRAAYALHARCTHTARTPHARPTLARRIHPALVHAVPTLQRSALDEARRPARVRAGRGVLAGPPHLRRAHPGCGRECERLSEELGREPSRRGVGLVG